MDPTPSYLTEVRSFDHTPLAEYTAYVRLRQALSDLANEVREDSRLKLSYWLEAVRDMAVTSPYGDMCSQCTKRCAREHERPASGLCPCGAYSATYWPHAVERDGNWMRGTYRCPNGHEWTCGYAVDVMRYL